MTHHSELPGLCGSIRLVEVPSPGQGTDSKLSRLQDDNPVVVLQHIYQLQLGFIQAEPVQSLLLLVHDAQSRDELAWVIQQSP